MDDLGRLQGRWRVTALEIDDQALPEAAIAEAEIHVEGETFTALGMGAVYSGRLTVDVTADPRRFSLIFADGPEVGSVNFGIYELDEDRWRFCINMTGHAAPAAFATTPGSNCALETLERIQPNLPA